MARVLTMPTVPASFWRAKGREPSEQQMIENSRLRVPAAAFWAATLLASVAVGVLIIKSGN